MPGPKDHHFRDSAAGDVDHARTGDVEHVILELVAERLALDQRIRLVAGPKRTERSVACFGAGGRKHLSQLFIRGIFLHGAERRQSEDAERRLIACNLAQRLGRLTAIQIGQGLGRVETDFRILRRHAFEQRIDAFRADRL